jgi:hypothetical protein
MHERGGTQACTLGEHLTYENQDNIQIIARMDCRHEETRTDSSYADIPLLKPELHTRDESTANDACMNETMPRANALSSTVAFPRQHVPAAEMKIIRQRRGRYPWK